MMEESSGHKSTDDSQTQAEVAIVEKMDEMAVETKEKGREKEVKKGKKVKDADHMNRAIMQTLSGLHTPEEKMLCLSKKYAELMVEHKALQRDVKVQQKQHSTLQRERDHLQSEHGRAVLAKSKLESLCRELQRHNKTIKEESFQRSKEEEEKRKEVSAKFQQTINDITGQMQENHTRNLKLKEENLDLATKLKSLVEQYERREEHIEKLFKHKELESQLYDAKIQQANITLIEEKDQHQREKAMLLAEVADNQRKCDILSKQESELKAQLTVYTEKFEEFQATLTKSNDVFQTLKHEMDKMTKKIKKLESETNMWRIRWENTNQSLLAMAEQKTHHEREAVESRNKCVRLEKLCRALQGERNALLEKARTESNTPETSCQQKVEEKEAEPSGVETTSASQEDKPDKETKNVEECSQEGSNEATDEPSSSIKDID